MFSGTDVLAAEGKSKVIYNKGVFQHSLMVGIPSTGIVRLEWAMARYGQVIPVNWSCGEFTVSFSDQLSPIGWLVHDARNIIVEQIVKQNIEWLIFVDHDVILPPDCFQKLMAYVESREYPVVSGLYFTKGQPSEPLLFRGRGNGPFRKYKMGEKVMVDGVPCGCLLIHNSILSYMWDNSPEYKLPDGRLTRLVFNTPRNRFFDFEAGVYNTQIGTEDLWWCDRILNEDVLKHAGFKALAQRKYPFLVDTSIFCRHIDTNTGQQFP